MVVPVEIILNTAEVADETALRRAAAKAVHLSENDVFEVKILRRSLDARSRFPVFRLKIEVFIGEIMAGEPPLLENLKPVSGKKKAIIVGAGPCGYFAALELIELGIQPIVIDRGKDVQARRRDLRAIQQFGEVNPHSNYCFGEGGAGTYSDGKLYTRSVKRGNVQKTLQLLVEHGAPADILIDAHPHIGSNKLPNVVQNIRETILKCGGEVHFDAHVVDFLIKDKKIAGVRTVGVSDGIEKEWLAGSVIVATGHSARDIYYLLEKKGVRLEMKPFALGVRVEHPQLLIDKIQYRQPERDPHLPASSYSLVCQIGGRGVFSFCMCPGGLVVPAATAPGEIVVNGMSMSRRDSPFANSGMVVAVEPEDLVAFEKYGVFAALEFQKSVEQRLFQSGDGSQKAPAMRLPDFISQKYSASLPPTSYIPGLFAAPLFELLPGQIYSRLRDGLAEFGRQMPGFMTAEANVIGTESRTSSPVRIPRDAESLQHPEVGGLFPAGEGAGFAGGIISAAMDGQRSARAVAKMLG